MADMCSECGAEFASPADLLNYMKVQHPVEAPKGSSAPVTAASATARREPFQCAVCGEVFETRNGLAHHNLTVDHQATLAEASSNAHADE